MTRAAKPGKLTGRQRDLIRRAVGGSLESFRIAVGEWSSLNGLCARGLIVERDRNTFELTSDGRRVAEAIERLRQ